MARSPGSMIDRPILSDDLEVGGEGDVGDARSSGAVSGGSGGDPYVRRAEAERGAGDGRRPVDLSDPWPSDDPLGVALHFLRMRGAFYCRSELTAPWGLALPPMPGHLWFHVMTTGRCWLEVDGLPPRELIQGELVLVPHGAGHVLRSGPGVHAPSILDLEREVVSSRYEILRHGGGKTAATMICGAVRFDHPAAGNVLRLLPRILHMQRMDSPYFDWLQSTLKLMAVEARALRPGGETVITRLADVVVALAIRSWIESDPAARGGWLGALRDREIGRALTLIHRYPERGWTVASLAREVAMSRSAFAERFTRLVGEPAMTYLTRWRMQIALGELQEGASVRRIAHRLGYQSEAGFGRAFKRVLGVSPGAVRRGVPEAHEPPLRADCGLPPRRSPSPA